MSTLLKTFGLRMKRERERQGKTQAEIASACQVGRTSICNMEAGRQDPPLTSLYAVARALGVEATQLLPTERELTQTATVTIDGQSYNVPLAEAEMIRQGLSRTEAV